MFTTKKTVTVAALSLAAALSVGAAVSAQGQSGPPSRMNDRTPALSGDYNVLRVDGTVHDDSAPAVTPSTTPAPIGLPTDADHTEGDDSVGSVAAEDVADDESGDDVADDNDASDGADDVAGHDVGAYQSGNQDDSSGQGGSDD
jgi:hypothetical protein